MTRRRVRLGGRAIAFGFSDLSVAILIVAAQPGAETEVPAPGNL